MAEHIEREALLERIDDIWDCNDMVFRPNDHCCNVPEDCKGCKWAETRDAIRRIVENAPTADVRPVVRGEWIVCGDGENVPYMCSRCGKTAPAVLIEKYPHNYCPNCGAEMKEDV